MCVCVYLYVTDVYLCAVLICSVGLLCMCMFTVTITCQYIQRKQRLKGEQQRQDEGKWSSPLYQVLNHKLVSFLQIITTWSKVHRTGTVLKYSYLYLKICWSSADRCPRHFPFQLRRDGHQCGQHVSSSASKGEEVQEEEEQEPPGGDTTRDTSQRSFISLMFLRRPSQ